MRHAGSLRTVVLSGLLATTVILGGCSSAGEDAETTSTGDFETVTIDSALGRAVITDKP